MNISSRTAFQVGLLVFVGIIVFIGGWIFIKGLVTQQNTYPLTFVFHNAEGLAPQASVELAGVKIGMVKEIGLSADYSVAEAHVEILKKWHIPVGSTVTISASVLGGSASIAIMPPQPLASGRQVAFIAPGQTIRGQDPFSIASIAAQAGQLSLQFATTSQKANALLDQATTLARNANGLIGNPRVQATLMSTLQNLNTASQNGVQATQAMHQYLAADNAQIQTSLHNINSMTASLLSVTRNSQGNLRTILGSLDQSAAQLDQITSNANQKITQGQTVEKLNDTMANLRDATAKMNGIMNDISNLTGDPKLQQDLKDTLHNAAVASEGAKQLAQRLNGLAGGHSHPAKKGDMQFMSRLDFTQNFRTNKFRTDVNLYAPLSGTDFARVGLYDLTETNRLNLQYGIVSPYNKLLTYRAGIYDSKVGIGADYDLFGGNTLSLDLYDPNHLRLDAQQRIRVNDNVGLWLGLQDVPRTNGVTVGVELQR